MKKFKVLTLLLCTVIVFSCKDQLDVKNPNFPTTDAINTENNIISLGLGMYFAGTNGLKYGGFQGNFMNDALAYHEIMGDVIGVEAANVYINQLGMPDWVKLDNGSTVLNPATPNTQLGLLRFANVNSFAAANPVYYEWAYMYAMNNTANIILKNVDGITYTRDADTKKNTLKAWAYWWKGWAYSRIGSLYYAGIISNEPFKLVSDYASHDAMIVEANANFDKALAALAAVTTTADYNTVIGALIPSIFKTGKGVAPSVAQWTRSINTMKARNLLVNTRASAMTNAQWSQVLAFANAGITAADPVFLGRSNTTADFMSNTGGNVAMVTAGDPATTTYKISERLIQDFKPGDKRFTNNFTGAAGGKWLGNSDRGNAFNTRYALLASTTGIGPAGAGVAVYAYQPGSADGAEIYLAGSYEENELMKAEANLYLGNLSAAATNIDNVRNAQGAGLGTTSIPDFATGKEELRRERRIGLVFRALAFYDARRWGVLDPVSSGGGRTGAIVVDKSGTVNSNATINYNYLDYWDVPDNEIVFNPPSANSAPTKNPRAN